MRRQSLVLWIAVAGLVLGGGTAAAQPPAAEKHPSGITILHKALPVPHQLDDELSAAFAAADRLSTDNSDDFGYPWADRSAHEVVVPTVGAAGAAKARGLNVRHRTVAAAHSRAYLQKILDETIGRTPEGITVWADYPDPENSRVILEVESAPDAFLNRLAATYDPAALAVLVGVAPHDGRPADSRSSDSSTFAGGANINAPAGGCTDGFSWYSGSTEMMLTAGHCAYSGGSISTPAMSMGSVNSGSEESWTHGTGTVYMTGQSTYRGDIALIRVASGKYTGPWIYRGPAGASSSYLATVKEMWSRSPAAGDQYCTGGAYSGEVCGWSTAWAAGNWTYGGTGEVARHVSKGTKHGWCVRPGDSGGPVYTVRSDGGIAAKGIISGESGHGGSDYYTGSLEPSCVNIYSDVWDAYYGLPGFLKVS